MTTLVVTRPFGSYTAGQTIADDATVAAILAGPNAIYVVKTGDGSSGSSGSNPGNGTGTTTPPPTSSGLTLADVDGEIATALTAKGLPPGTTVPALISAAGTGSGISAAQAAALALALG